MVIKLAKYAASVLGIVVALGAWQSAGAVPVKAWSITNPEPFRNDSWSFGDIFTVGGSNISVVGLGAFDASLNGYVTPGGIPVGIFRESDSVLLTSTSVLSGDALDGNYRFHAIAPITLLANTRYRVVGVNRNDLYNIRTGTPNSVDPRITWNSYGYCRTTLLTKCDAFTGTERTWMANMLLDVPEPATLTLFGLGLAGLGFARRRKQKAA